MLSPAEVDSFVQSEKLKSEENNLTIIDPSLEPRWDKFVECHPFGWIYHLSAWNTILKKSFPHIICHYVIIEKKDSGCIQAALPLHEVHRFLTGKRLVSIPFATLGDPLVSNAQELALLLKTALSLSKKLNIKKIEVHALQSERLFPETGFRKMSYYQQHFIELNKKPEELIQSFHRSCVRGRIKKSLKQGLILRKATDRVDLKAFYRLHLINRKRLGLPPHPYEFFESLWMTFSGSGKLQIYFAEYGNHAVAAALLLKFKERVSLEYLVWDDAFSCLSPNHFLIWHAINLSYKENFKIFDFGRTSIYNENLMIFKNRWGTKVANLPYFCYPNNGKEQAPREKSIPYRAMKPLFRRAPDPVYRFMGWLCYHHTF